MDNLNSLEKRSILDRSYIKKGRKMLTGKINNSFYIWQLINLNLFFENTKIHNSQINDKK